MLCYEQLAEVAKHMPDSVKAQTPCSANSEKSSPVCIVAAAKGKAVGGAGGSVGVSLYKCYSR